VKPNTDVLGFYGDKLFYSYRYEKVKLQDTTTANAATNNKLGAASTRKSMKKK
jgi:hypothetical protein